MYNLERKKTLYHRFERDGLHTTGCVAHDLTTRGSRDYGIMRGQLVTVIKSRDRVASSERPNQGNP